MYYSVLDTIHKHALSLFLIMILVCSNSFAQKLSYTKITNDVFVFHPEKPDKLEIIREVGGNVTVIRIDSGIVVIDSFVSHEVAENARSIIHELFPKNSIRFLICTHHHADHIRGNQVFKDAKIIGHKNVAKYMMEDYDRLVKKYGHYQEEINKLEVLAGQYSEKKDSIDNTHKHWKEVKAFFETYKPSPPTIFISSDTVLKIGEKTFEIFFYGPAHTNNDIVILDREDRLLVMGDLVCPKKCYLMGSQSDITNWIDILDKLLKRKNEYEFVIPGHGGICENADALSDQKEYLVDIKELVLEAKRSGLPLEKVKYIDKLNKYCKYLMYDKIDLDIETCWDQLSETK